MSLRVVIRHSITLWSNLSEGTPGWLVLKGKPKDNRHFGGVGTLTKDKPIWCHTSCIFWCVGLAYFFASEAKAGLTHVSDETCCTATCSTVVCPEGYMIPGRTGSADGNLEDSRKYGQNKNLHGVPMERVPGLLSRLSPACCGESVGSPWFHAWQSCQGPTLRRSIWMPEARLLGLKNCAELVCCQ